MTNSPEKIKVGISSCLLGNSVRYDGGHKHDANIIETLGDYFEFIPFCPEAESGMGVPRIPMHLVRRGKKILALRIDDHEKNFTQQLENYTREKHQQISVLSGYIFKKNSPSCGMQNVRVYKDNANAEILNRTGEGIFARSLKQQFPQMPVEEESGLNDLKIQKKFIERVFAYYQNTLV